MRQVQVVRNGVQGLDLLHGNAKTKEKERRLNGKTGPSISHSNIMRRLSPELPTRMYTASAGTVSVDMKVVGCSTDRKRRVLLD